MDRDLPDVNAILPEITSIETHLQPSSSTFIAQLHTAAGNVTHILPSYTIIGRSVNNRIWGRIRRVIIEEIYSRARVVFPDQLHAEHPADDS